MEVDIISEKEKHREKIRKISDRLSRQYREKASEEIEKYVMGSDYYHDANTIFCYLSIDTEPNTRNIISEAIKSGKRICVPMCTENYGMKAVRIFDMNNLRQNSYGIYEPVSDEEALEPEEIELVIAPCLSASKDGKRIGKGKGYYDRFLAKTETTPIIVLCFESLISEEIPIEKNDILADAVVTELGIERRTENGRMHTRL